MPSKSPPPDFVTSQSDKLIRAAGLRYSDATFDSFEIGNDEHSNKRRHAFNTVGNWVANESWRSGSCLLLCGRCGTGKDHLAVAAAKRIIEVHGACCHYATGAAIFREAKDFDAGGLNLEKYTDRHVLILSDIVNASGGVSEFEAGVLYSILDARYRDQLPCVVSVNANGANDLDDRIGKRVADRLLHRATVTTFDWPSYRRQQ